MSWVEEIVAHNNRANGERPPSVPFGTDVGAGHGVPVSVEPARICFTQIKQVSNPGISYNELVPLCGKPQRSGDGARDAVTLEKETVTCADCLRKLSGQMLEAPHSTGASFPSAADASAGATQGPDGFLNLNHRPAPLPSDFSYQDFLDQVLDVAGLKDKQRSLQAELAAVEVLLQAAQAREAFRSPAGATA